MHGRRGLRIRYLAFVLALVLLGYFYFHASPTDSPNSTPKPVLDSAQEPVPTDKEDPKEFTTSDPDLKDLLSAFPECEIRCTFEQWQATEILSKGSENTQSFFPKDRKQQNGPRWPTPSQCDKTQGESVAKTSQVGQDEFVIDYYNYTCGRTFIELGATNELSNTLFLETAYKWRGLCIEATPSLYAELVGNRPDCISVNALIANVPPGRERVVKFLTTAWTGLDGIWESWSTYQKKNIVELMKVRKDPRCSIHCLPVVRLQTILSQYDLHHIDYFSLDVEGLEEEVLKTIDWDKTTVELFTIEDGNEWGTPNARDFLINNLGYSKIKDLQWDSVVAKKFEEK